MSNFISIESALDEIRQGNMVILVDNEHRENEGDIVFAAEKVTADLINFMTKNARGLICLTMTEEKITELGIPLMPQRNKLPNQPAFTVSIEAAMGVTTGVSAHDRACTILAAVNPHASSNDISMPGHVFPIQARKGGVLERQGHTEGSVDLVRLAGLQPAAVICEIMNEDGSMARVPDLLEFAKTHGIKLVSIDDLIAYRIRHETQVEEVATALLPIEHQGDFTIKVFYDALSKMEHVAMVRGELRKEVPCLVRIHSECLTGDAFGSERCDCGWQLQQSIQQISQSGGVLLYMRQEGRGIGLANKIKAYQLQSTLGLDTVEANHQLGFMADQRHYGICAQMLRALDVQSVRLLTNNPKKQQDLEQFGIQVIERVALEMKPTEKNSHYLQVKRDKLGHLLTLS